MEKLQLDQLLGVVNPSLSARNENISGEAKQVFAKWVIDMIRLQPNIKDQDELLIMREFDLMWIMDENPYASYAREFADATDWRNFSNTHTGIVLRQLAYDVVTMRRTIRLVRRLLVDPKENSVPPARLLVFRVRDDDHQGVEVARLVEILNGLRTIVRAVDPESDGREDVRVVFTDSGSDLTFGFTLPDAIVYYSLLNFIKFAYTEWRDWDFNKSDRSVRSILTSARGMVEVNRLVGRDGLSPKQKRQVDKGLTEGLDVLLRNGVYPDDESKPEAVEVRRLPKPPLRLTAGTSPDEGAQREADAE
jgi:hypothetical protein